MNGTRQEPAESPAGREEQTPLLTIGYGARTIDAFIATLEAHRIELLIDVRTAPFSKFKPDFSKDLLAYHLRRAGIRYQFMGDSLGGQPNDPACLTDGKVDYDKVRGQPFFRKGLEQLASCLRQTARAVLMCSEGRPEQCHRSKLIGEALTRLGVPIGHIDEDGQTLTQAQVIDRLTQGQMDLFGQSSFTSRKRYGPRGAEG